MKKFLAVAALLTLSNEATPSLAQVDYSPCVVMAAVVMGPNELGQYLLHISIPTACDDEGRLARIITRNGGRLPPFGYFKLGQNAPTFIRYWVFKGAKVQDRKAPNVWVTVPIKGAKVQDRKAPNVWVTVPIKGAKW